MRNYFSKLKKKKKNHFYDFNHKNHKIFILGEFFAIIPISLIQKMQMKKSFFF